MTTKIHLLADALGRPLRFLLTAGQVHEITQAERLLEEADGGAVLADKGYDCNALRQSILAKGMTPVIPTLRSRKVQISYDREAYKLRNRIERCFCRLKSFRRIATRFDRRAPHFLASLHLAAFFLWSR